jgi:hypothetical protein
MYLVRVRAKSEGLSKGDWYANQEPVETFEEAFTYTEGFPHQLYDVTVQHQLPNGTVVTIVLDE